MTTASEAGKRKQAEEALRVSEDRYRTLVESLPQKIFAKDRDSVYISCNENYARDLDIQAEEIAGKDDYAFYSRELADTYRADDKRIMESGKTEELEEKYVVEGQEFWVHTIKTPIRDDDGGVTGILGIFWDITERKRAIEQVTRQQEQLLAIFDNFPEILYVTDPDTYEVLFVNKAFEQLLGRNPKGEICYKAFQGFEEPCAFCTNDIILEKREPYTWEYRNPVLDRDYQITDQIIRWPDGRDVRFELALDITERKRVETEIQQHRDHLEEQVKERTAELEGINQQLQQELAEGKRREQIISQQTEEILELSTPVVQVWEGVVAATLIGSLDSGRAQRFMEVLLERIVETNSQVALVDITGVPAIDTQTAQNLIETVSAVKLLGAQVVLTGVRPAIAQTLVHLGIDLSEVTTRASLAAGLRVALDNMGISMDRKNNNTTKRRI